MTGKTQTNTAESDTKTVIHFSRRRIARGLFGMLVLAASGAFVALAPWLTDIQMAPASYGWLFQIAGLVVAIVAMIPVVTGLNGLWQPRPGVVIDRDGVWNMTNGTDHDLIPWADITDLGQFRQDRKHLIMLYTDKPQKYIDRQTTRHGKQAAEATRIMTGTPLAIEPAGLTATLPELMHLLDEYFERFARK